MTSFSSSSFWTAPLHEKFFLNALHMRFMSRSSARPATVVIHFLPLRCWTRTWTFSPWDAPGSSAASLNASLIKVYWALVGHRWKKIWGRRFDICNLGSWYQQQLTEITKFHWGKLLICYIISSSRSGLSKHFRDDGRAMFSLVRVQW